MSAPPPGGSPPPQQPPQYPPYAQQPPQYPPQYAQQPYYPQAAPPPKKSNTVFLVVIVVVIVVVVLAVLAWWAVTSLMRPVTQMQITVTAVSFSINYPGTTHYFGSTPISTCTNCPFTINFLSNFGQTITLTNSDSVTHTVANITLSGLSFEILQTTPSLPTTIAAGATKSIVLTIQPITFTGGSYSISGAIDTT